MKKICTLRYANYMQLWNTKVDNLINVLKTRNYMGGKIIVSFGSAKSSEIPSIPVMASMQLLQGITFQENSGNKTFGQLFDSNIVTNISPTSTWPPLARYSYKKLPN